MKSNKKLKEIYVMVNKDNLSKIFTTTNNRVYLKNSKAMPIIVNFPLKLDEKIARICAMIMDGSLTKDLCSLSFSQKKDRYLVKEMGMIVKSFFNIHGNYYIDKKTDTPRIEFSRKTFVHFAYTHLDLHKSDENARIPKWIFKSPRSVIIEYLRYAFAMEGSINHYLKGSEVRFHSVSLPYLQDLKKILIEKFKIESKIQKYYIKDYGNKYYLMFNKVKDILKFTEIGFALETHQKRLIELVNYLTKTKKRSRARTNEKQIILFLKKNGKSYRNQIARELLIDVCTVRDVLKRLLKHRKIDFLYQDKFQRKFYSVISDQETKDLIRN